MTSKFLETLGSWRNVADSARTTISKEPGTKEPSSQWKRRLLLSEHSPIRQISIRFIWQGLKSWISVHFVRHKFGIEHFVSTQRTDRTGVNRDDLKQSNLVNHEILINQQAIINISRKRLCSQASSETRKSWKEFLKSIEKYHPELVSVAVVECVYRNGFCPEYKSCGYNQTEKFEKELCKYVKDMEHQINSKLRLK